MLDLAKPHIRDGNHISVTQHSPKHQASQESYRDYLTQETPNPKYSNLSQFIKGDHPLYREIVKNVDFKDMLERKKVRKLARFNHEETRHCFQKLRKQLMISPNEKSPK